MKTALLLDGPGFSDQGDVEQYLVLKGFRVLRRVIGFESGKLELPELGTADLILIRGPWSVSPEDKLIASILADRLSDSLKRIRQSGGFLPHQTVVAIGRGALVLMFSELLKDQVGKIQTWETKFSNVGPWLKVKILPQETELLGLILGRAMPKFLEPLPDGFTKWLEIEGQPVGWKQGDNVFITLVDILAYAERNQLANFGYGDYSEIPTQAQVIDALVERDFSQEGLFAEGRVKMPLV